MPYFDPKATPETGFEVREQLPLYLAFYSEPVKVPMFNSRRATFPIIINLSTGESFVKLKDAPAFMQLKHSKAYQILRDRVNNLDESILNESCPITTYRESSFPAVNVTERLISTRYIMKWLINDNPQLALNIFNDGGVDLYSHMLAGFNQ